MSEHPANPTQDVWSFPCDLNLKVMGLAHYPLIDIVTEIVQAEIAGFEPTDVKVLPSRTGKYHSITMMVRIERREQMENIYRALSEREEVAWKL